MKQYQSGGRGCDQTDSRTVEQCADYWRCRQERKTHQQTRAEANDQYCVGGVLDLGLALDEGLRQGAVRGRRQEPDHHRSGREDADLVGAEEPGL